MKVYIGRYPKNPVKERKVRVRIDPWDTWSMDQTLIPIILPMLKQLKETKHGSPGSLPEFSQQSYASSQYCFDFYQEGDALADEAGHKHWEEIMDKMIWSFEQLGTDWEHQYHSGVHDIAYKDIPGSDLIEVVHGPNHTATFDFIGYTKHMNRIQEGLNLFGKYYINLWD